MRGCITRSFSKAVGHFSHYDMGSGSMVEVGTVECKAGKKVDAKKHQKSEMEYKGERHVGGIIKPDEMQYIINDVLVLKEALEYMLNHGNTRLTIGSNCLHEYRQGFSKGEWLTLYPDLKAIKLPEQFGYSDADVYIRRSYRGGWCYVKRGHAGQIKGVFSKDKTYHGF